MFALDMHPWGGSGSTGTKKQLSCKQLFFYALDFSSLPCLMLTIKRTMSATAKMIVDSAYIDGLMPTLTWL